MIIQDALLYTAANNQLLLESQYMDVPGETDNGHQKVSLSWPVEGGVEFNHVSLRYHPWLPPALNDVSFLIRTCEHVSYHFSFEFATIENVLCKRQNLLLLFGYNDERQFGVTLRNYISFKSS